MTAATRIIANALVFQSGWFLSVYYGNPAAIAVALIAIWIYARYYARDPAEYGLLATIVSIGFFGDTMLGLTGVLAYPSGLPFPTLWMMVLWLLFAMTLPWSLRWLIVRPKSFVCLCAIGGTFSYFFGVKLSDVSFGYEPVMCLIALATLWSLYGLVLHNLFSFWRNRCPAI